MSVSHQKLPPLFIIQATMAVRNLFKKWVRNMLPANFVMLEEISNFWKIQAIAVVTQLNIPDLLRKGPLTIDELARLSESHPQALGRVLRALAGDGIFKELPGDKFKNTRLSETLIQKEDSVRYFTLHHLGKINWELNGCLLHCVKTGENAITYKYGIDPFQFLEKFPEENKTFNLAMTETAELSGYILAKSYPFGKYKKLVDIGGGQGHLLKQIISLYPSVQGCVFDRLQVVAELSGNANNENHEKTIEYIAGNFFTDNIPAADVYILKNVLHDWDDENCKKILTNVAASMNAESRLLIIETLIQKDNRSSFGKYLDLQMLISTRGGRERTREEYQMLIQQSGLITKRVIPNATPFSIIEVSKG